MDCEKTPDYAALEAVLMEALTQAAHGKGRERHAQGRDFNDQPIMVIPRLLNDDMGVAHIYEAINKLQGSISLPTSPQRRAKRLEAIVYIAASILMPGCRVEGREGIVFGPGGLFEPPADVPRGARACAGETEAVRINGLFAGDQTREAWVEGGGSEPYWEFVNGEKEKS